MSIRLLIAIVVLCELPSLAPVGCFLPALLAQERSPERLGLPVTGRVLSATTAKPLAGVILTLAGQRVMTDDSGRFTFTQPPSGYQLIKLNTVHWTHTGSHRRMDPLAG